MRAAEQMADDLRQGKVRFPGRMWRRRVDTETEKKKKNAARWDAFRAADEKKRKEKEKEQKKEEER
jgi:hypothetical protein